MHAKTIFEAIKNMSVNINQTKFLCQLQFHFHFKFKAQKDDFEVNEEGSEEAPLDYSE